MEASKSQSTGCGNNNGRKWVSYCGILTSFRNGSQASRGPAISVILEMAASSQLLGSQSSCCRCITSHHHHCHLRVSVTHKSGMNSWKISVANANRCNVDPGFVYTNLLSMQQGLTRLNAKAKLIFTNFAAFSRKRKRQHLGAAKFHRKPICPLKSLLLRVSLRRCWIPCLQVFRPRGSKYKLACGSHYVKSYFNQHWGGSRISLVSQHRQGS